MSITQKYRKMLKSDNIYDYTIINKFPKQSPGKQSSNLYHKYGAKN